MTEQRNWAGNITFSTTRLHHPETVAQVQEVVRSSRKVRVLGSRHSFNAIADSPGDLIALDRLAPVFVVDRERHTATVDAGTTYGRLCRQLHQEGYALPNTASLPHITIAGACATATHGSGDHNGILATRVAAIEFVAAEGTVVALSRDEHGDQFAGAVVALGGLGVVTQLTLDLIPAFSMRQDVYENLPFSQLEAHFDAIVSHAYSVSLFTDWGGDRVNQVWVKRVVSDEMTDEPERTFFEATPALTDLHPLPSLDAATCTPQLGVVGPWYERLPHFRMEFTPNIGEELQSEYFVPRRHAVAALRALNSIRQQIAPLLQMSEVRTIAADDLWMSPFHERASVALHFTWRKDWDAVRELLPHVEAHLARFDATPHWGKLFTMSAERVQARYPKLPEFRRLLHSYDPEGKFRNAFMDTYIFGAPDAS